ncbi:hypothetical protein MHYP_G00283990 [Metynnis hypsauchen]
MEKTGKKGPPAMEQPFIWTEVCENAFQALKSRLLTAPVPVYPDYSLPFALQTDAPLMGLGAVLAQYTKPKHSGRHQGNEHERLLLKEWKRLVVKDETLYRQVRDKQRGCFHQLVLPEKFRSYVKSALHDGSGHFGVECTFALVKERFYWPLMFCDKGMV